MWTLIKIVIPNIQAKWDDVAYSMRYDIGTVNTIRTDCKTAELCCKHLFENWLSTSHGITPKTWHVLLTRIKDVASLQEAAEAIERDLTSEFENR